MTFTAESILPRRRGARILAVMVPMALAVVVGLPGIHGTFARDDWVYVPLNPLVSGDASIGTVFRSSFDPEHDTGLYRPLTTLSLMWNWRTAGETTWPYHATNLVLAAIGAGLLAGLLLGWNFVPLGAGLAAAAFAVHPARSEAVLWIAGRAELLMTAFALLALVIAQSARSLLRWPLCAIAAVASALSKEQGFVLVALVPLLPGLRGRDRIIGFLALVVSLGAAVVWRQHVLGGIGPEGAMQVLPKAGTLDLVTFGLHHLGRYVRLLFWPHPLITEYDDPVLPVGWLWVSVGVLAALSGPLLLMLRRPRAAFGALLFLVPLLPVLNVFYRTGETFAERFLCLPSAGFSVLLALSFAGLPPRFRGIAASTLAAIVLVLGARFCVRARDWTSQRTLVEAQLRDAPEVGGSWQVVAADLLDEFGLDQSDPEDVPRAGMLLTRALEIAPHRAGAAVSLAKVHLRKAHRMKQQDPEREPELREAERLFRAAIEADSALLQAHGALGLVLVDLGRRDEAERMMREELRLHPDENRAAQNLARLLEDSHRPDEARRVREDAIRAALAHAEAHPGRSGPLCVAAQFAFDLGQADRAVELMQRALALRESPEIRSKTAIDGAALFVSVGRGDEARRLIESTRTDLAQGSDPSPALALALANLDQALGEKDRARQELEAALPSARGLSQRRLKAALAALK